MVTVGLLHPGEMGAAVGRCLVGRGYTVLWVPGGRSAATAARASAAGLTAAGSLAELVRRAEVIVSVCPPHAALDVARQVAGFGGIYVDANAISPATAREVAAVVEAGGADVVDGGIIGPPPVAPGHTRLYLSGVRAGEIGRLFEGTALDARVIDGGDGQVGVVGSASAAGVVGSAAEVGVVGSASAAGVVGSAAEVGVVGSASAAGVVGSASAVGVVGSASAVKMAYAAWTKGTAALVLAARALARAEGVEDVLLGEWALSQPGLEDRSAQAAWSAAAKGWRWIAEMEEIAAAMSAAGLPDGFHRAAAEIYRRSPADGSLDAVLNALFPPL